MVSEEKANEERLQHCDVNDGSAKQRQHDGATKMTRSFEVESAGHMHIDESSDEYDDQKEQLMDNSGELKITVSNDGDGSDDDIVTDKKECVRDAEGKCTKHRHIRPCICDLTKQQRKRIEAFHKRKRDMQRKYDHRVKEIEIELARLEEERLEREREALEQEELFGDEYELVGEKRKRKKRSARRASMVSLGIKQVINWRKQPRIEVKMTTASTLRKTNNGYCGRIVFPPWPTKSIDFHKGPSVLVRMTVASDVRFQINARKKNWLIKQEDKRPIFQTPYYV